jgi:hypothetical protein
VYLLDNIGIENVGRFNGIFYGRLVHVLAPWYIYCAAIGYIMARFPAMLYPGLPDGIFSNPKS